MSGPLPTSLANLRLLQTLQTSGTGLCAPSDARFLEWLKGISTRRVALCADALAHAYLTQAVQSRDYPVPLVAGEKALLRVFLTSRSGANADIPPVRARFYVDGQDVHVGNIPGKPGPIPSEVWEGDLSNSANAEIPAHVVRPGLEMVIEPDPDGTLDPALGVAKRIPETGRLTVEVRIMPLFDLPPRATVATGRQLRPDVLLRPKCWRDRGWRHRVRDRPDMFSWAWWRRRR